MKPLVPNTSPSPTPVLIAVAVGLLLFVGLSLAAYRLPNALTGASNTPPAAASPPPTMDPNDPLVKLPTTAVMK